MSKSYATLTITDITDMVDVGKRNYARNTGELSKWIRNTNIPASNIDKNEAHLNHGTTKTWNYVISMYPKIDYNLLKNKQVTISFWLKSDCASEDGYLYVTLSRSNNTDRTSSKTRYGSLFSLYATEFTTGYVRYSNTVTINDAFFKSGDPADGDDYIFIQFYNYSLADVYVKDIKLELGSSPSDWQIAPEDIAEQVEEAKAEAENAVTQANANYYGVCGDTGTNRDVSISGVSRLREGLVIYVKFNTATVSNMTLNVNGLGAKSVYYNNNSTGSYGAANAIVALVYDTTTNSSGCWKMLYSYNSDTTSETRYSGAIKAKSAITQGYLIVGDANGYFHVGANKTFDLTYPILYTKSSIASGGTGTETYSGINVAISPTQSMTLTAHKMVYLKGKLSGTNFTTASSNPITQAVPTNADGYQYIDLGIAYSSTGFRLTEAHSIYQYSNGTFHNMSLAAIAIANDAVADAAEAMAAIGNLVIGGRNLIMDSDKEISFTTGTVDIFEVTNYGRSNVKAGDTLSLSFEAKASTPLYIDFYPRSSSTSYTAVISEPFHLTTQYAYYSCVFPAPTTINFTNIEYLRVRQSSSAHGTNTAVGTVYIKNIKLEKGNMITDWTPAPEDINARVDAFEVGGTNLLRERFKTNDSTVLNVAKKYLGNGYWELKGTPNSTGVISLYTLLDNLQYEPSQYTLSVYGESTGLTQTYVSYTRAGGSSTTVYCPIDDKTITFEDTQIDSWRYVGVGVTNGVLVNAVIRLKFEKGSVGTDWSPAPEDSDDKLSAGIESIVIGNRNLLLDTKTPLTLSSGVKTYNVSDYGKTIVTAGDKVAVSFDYVATGSTAFDFYMRNSSSTVMNKNVVLSATTTKKHYDGVIDADTVTGWATFAFRATTSVSGYNSAYSITISNVKVERGTKCTSYTEAPEDYDKQMEDFVNSLDDIQTQVDGKIETFSQTTDPSTAWTTTELKNQHKGDLWYNSSTKKTQRWSGTTWVNLENAEAQAAATLAGTKAQVFTSTPTVPYYKGDLWITDITNKTGVVKTCKTTRTSGSYTASEWVEGLKYTDDSAVENLVIGGNNLLLDSDRNSVTKVTASTSRYIVNENTYTTLTTSFINAPSNTPCDAKYALNFVCNNTTASSNGKGISFYNGSGVKLIAGEEYTASCYARVTNLTSGTLDVGFSYGGSNLSTAVYKTLTTSWKRYVFSFTAPSTSSTAAPYADGTTRVVFRGTVNANSAGTIQMTGFQLEKGNKATDWTLSPSDIVGDINDKIDNIEVGGKNLLLDSDTNALMKISASANRYLTNTAGETYCPVSFAEIVSIDAPCKTKNIIRFAWNGSSTASSTRGLAFYDGVGVFLNPGEEYTVSFYARTKGTVSGTLEVYNTYGQSSYVNTTGYIAVNSSWQRITQTFVAPATGGNYTYNSGDANGSTRIYFYTRGSAGAKGTVEMCGFQLEKGNKATDYAPAPIDENEYKSWKTTVEQRISDDGIMSAVTSQLIIGNRNLLHNSETLVYDDYVFV